jgi:anion-transporting  ArsA/GET3 family ATPase
VRPAASPVAALRERRVVVCLGCGGVGKTTVSAALALLGARLGRRVLVLTIDPARRLADALGLEDVGHEPRRLGRDVLAQLGVPPEGELSAAMLDMKRTFDDLVARFAPSEAERERILRNPIYQHVSDALAGSAEYSAMEKVHQLSESKDLDLIVLDTPPAQHALDFLEAPERLLGFLESSLVRLMLHPAFAAGRTGFRLFQRGTARVLKLLERISGLAFLEDVSEFLLAFEGMSEGFRERARSVERTLLGPGTGFVLAAGPGGEAAAQGAALLERLEAMRVPLAGLVANRMRVWPGGEDPPPAASADPEPLARALAAAHGADFPARAAAAAALDLARGYASLAERDARAVAPLSERVRQRGGFVALVPEFDRDVHDLAGLAAIADHLQGGAPAPPRSEPKASGVPGR